MPTVSRFFLKFGLVYFVAALLCGVAMAWVGGGWGAALLPTYLHLFVVGWITQMIIGVALWLFPKWTREKPRGREWLSWVALVGINVGLLIRVVAEPGRIFADPAGGWRAAFGWMLVVSAVLQWAGGMAFLVNIWGRIKGKKKRRRRKKKKSKDKEDEAPDDAEEAS